MTSNTFYALLSVALVVLLGFLMLSFTASNRNADEDAVTDLRIIDLTPPAESTTNIEIAPTMTTPTPVITQPTDEVDEITVNENDFSEEAQ